MRWEAKFTLTSDDILTGYRMRNKQGDDVWKLCVLAATLIALVFGVAAYLMSFLVIGVMGAVLVPVAFIPIAMEWNVRRLANKLPKEDLRFCFSDDGVEFSSSVVQSKHAWSLFTKAYLDQRGVLLFTDPLNYTFIPARAFMSGYFPRQELKELLSEKLMNA